jgi:hypothetical protein
MSSYLTTLALGLIFWIAFQELAKSRETLDAIGNREWQEVFRASLKRARGTIVTTGMHHARLLRGLVNPRTVGVVYDRARAYFSGELVADTPRVRGDLFVPLAMAALLARQAERLDGPMGAMFLDSVRQAHPQLADATLDQMADYFGQYDATQLDGVLAALRGQMFERMVEAAENADGDLWSAALHDDRNVPGSDIVFTHQDTGETIEISLNATDSTSYLEEAPRRYPDIPIVTTDEIAGILEHDPLVSGRGISNAEVRAVTEENYEELLAGTPRIETGIAGGLALASFAALYPFLIARARPHRRRPTHARRSARHRRRQPEAHRAPQLRRHARPDLRLVPARPRRRRARQRRRSARGRERTAAGPHAPRDPRDPTHARRALSRRTYARAYRPGRETPTAGTIASEAQHGIRRVLDHRRDRCCHHRELERQEPRRMVLLRLLPVRHRLRARARCAPQQRSARQHPRPQQPHEEVSTLC